MTVDEELKPYYQAPGIHQFYHKIDSTLDFLDKLIPYYQNELQDKDIVFKIMSGIYHISWFKWLYKNSNFESFHLICQKCKQLNHIIDNTPSFDDLKKYRNYLILNSQLSPKTNQIKSVKI